MPDQKTDSAIRKSSSFFVVMKSGQIHLCKGKVALSRALKDLSPESISMVIKGYQCRIVEKKSVDVEF